jgi:hypothetical protein
MNMATKNGIVMGNFIEKTAQQVYPKTENVNAGILMGNGIVKTHQPLSGTTETKLGISITNFTEKMARRWIGMVKLNGGITVSRSRPVQ